MGPRGVSQQAHHSGQMWLVWELFPSQPQVIKALGLGSVDGADRVCPTDLMGVLVVLTPVYRPDTCTEAGAT